jgi:DHA1 family tetracycline resistance protein-like MFS transporter
MNQRRALTFVLIAVCIDMIGLGIILPVMPQLIMTLSGKTIAESAGYGGAMFALYALMQFFFAPIMGNLSDRFGRRPVLLASLAAFAIDYAVMAMAPNLAWLFVGRAIAGICGASYTSASAYIADITPPEKRAHAFGLIGATWGIGFVLGPVIGGVLGNISPRFPFFATAALALINVIYGYFALHETLQPENRRAFDWKRANPLGALLQMRRYPIVIGLFAALFFYQIAHDSLPVVWSYYTIEKFKWTAAQIGISLAVVGLTGALVQGLLTGPAVKRLGERRATYMGFAVFTVGFIGIALAPTGWFLYVLLVPFALSGIAGPALNSIMSAQMPADSQGELQGAIACLVSLTAVISPLVMTQLFKAFTLPNHFYFPGAPYLAAAILSFVSLIIVGVVLRVNHARVPSEVRAAES